MQRLIACVIVVLIGSVTAAQFDLQADFSRPPEGIFRCLGEASVAQGVLCSRSLPDWQRSGLEIGPLPMEETTWRIVYDFRPLSLGAQGAEFTSQTPSAHHYMAYVHPGRGVRLHTRLNGEWRLRAESPNIVQVGRWHHVEITLTATSVQYVLQDKETGERLWDSGPIAMDNVGKETLAALVDEAPDTAAQTEWDNVRVSTDNSAALTRLRAKAQEIAREREHEKEIQKLQERLRAMGLPLLPTPQQARFTGAFLRSTDLRPIGEQASQAFITDVKRVLQEQLSLPCRGGTPVRLILWPAGEKRPWANAQGYRLRLSPAGIRLEAESRWGFLYGAQTLCQLAMARMKTLSGAGAPAAKAFEMPCGEILDWPDIMHRLVMIAIDQGAFQKVEVDYWKRLIRELAAVKINYIMPYFEGAGFYYEKYPFLALKGKEGFTKEKARALSEYAWQYGIRLVPQQEALGHAGSILFHPELRHLAESSDVFCSSNPETFQFLSDLFDELIAAFPYADYIHVGGDEFGHGFAKCERCRQRVEEIGKPGLYAEHMMKLRQILAARGRKIMIWRHEEGYTEEAAERLAKDIVVFDWHYGNQSSYPSLERLQEKGFAQTWATPAVTRYYDGSNDWHNTFGNISGFLRAGARRGVPGECTCTWVHGIWGGRNLFELNLYGLLYSAQCAWNAWANDAADFRWRFAARWFSIPVIPKQQLMGEKRGKAMSGLGTGANIGRGGATPTELDGLMRTAMHEPYGSPTEQGFWRNNRVLEEMLAAPFRQAFEAVGAQPQLAVEAARLQGFCQQAYASLEALRRLARRNGVTLDFMAHDVHIHDTLARRILLAQQLREHWPQLRGLAVAERRERLAPIIRGLQALLVDYATMEQMFERSIKEAGGGRCGWGSWIPFVASGGIMFRAPQGRAEIQKVLIALEQATAAEKPPETPF